MTLAGRGYRMDAAKQIQRTNRKRHGHHSGPNLEFCKRCGAFVNKGDPDGAGRVRYRCGACGRALLEYQA